MLASISMYSPRPGEPRLSSEGRGSSSDNQRATLPATVKGRSCMAGTLSHVSTNQAPDMVIELTE